MSYHECITASLPDMRTCIARGEHRQWCDGYARRYDRTLGRDVITDDECRGCLPAEAEFGWLCASHIARLDAALRAAPELVGRLIADPSNGTRDTNEGGGHVAASPSWPLLESRTQAAWIVAALRNIVRVLDGEDYDLTYFESASLPIEATARQARLITDGHARYLLGFGAALGGTARGAEACVRLTDLVQAANHRFAAGETARKIPGVRCPQCSLPQLVWHPPLAQRDDVVVRCSHCRHEEGQEFVERYAAVLNLRSAV